MSLWHRLKQEWLEPFLFFGNNLISLIGGALDLDQLAPELVR